MIFSIYFVLLTCSLTGIFTLHKNSISRIRQQNNTFTPKGPEARNETWKNPNLPFWSNVNYAGEQSLPTQAFKKVRSFPMLFFDIGPNNQILDKRTRTVIPGNYILNKQLIIFLFYKIIITSEIFLI